MRDIPPAVQALLGNDVTYPAYFLDLDLDSGPIRIWTGRGPMTYDPGDGAVSYDGLGDFIAISSVEERADLAANNVRVTLSGIPSDYVAKALTEQFRGRRARMHLVFFTDATFATIAGGFELYSGFGDVSEMAEDGQTARFTLTVENRLIELQAATTRVWTRRDQRSLRDPDDSFFDNVERIQELDLGQWGA